MFRHCLQRIITIVCKCSESKACCLGAKDIQSSLTVFSGKDQCCIEAHREERVKSVAGGVVGAH